jgi:chromosome segregation ATPase
LPELLELRRGREVLIGYPALLDAGDAVELQVFDSPEEAALEHRRGLTRLFALVLREPLRFFERNLPEAQKLALLYAPFGSADDLRRELGEHERELETAQLDAEERAELERLRRSIEEADRTRQTQERRRIQLEQELRRLRSENRDQETRLHNLADTEALATKRQERIQKLEEENQSLRATVEEQRTRESQERSERRQQAERIASLERTLQTQREREALLESAWREQRQQQWAEEARALHTKEHEWAQKHAQILSQQVETDLTKANEGLAKYKQLIASLENDLATKRKEISQLQLDLARAQSQLDVEKARIAGERQSLADERQRQEEHIARRETEAKGRIAEHKQDVETQLLQQQERTQQKVDAAQREAGELRKEVGELSARLGELKTQIEQLEQQREDLRDKILPREERLRPLQAKVFSPDELPNPITPESEFKWLSRIETDLEAAGYTFHPRLVRAFHTSLKVAKLAPLTILAGISGTGKSELPRLYADLGGVSFLPIPVGQPARPVRFLQLHRWTLQGRTFGAAAVSDQPSIGSSSPGADGRAAG